MKMSLEMKAVMRDIKEVNAKLKRNKLMMTTSKDVVVVSSKNPRPLTLVFPNGFVVKLPEGILRNAKRQ
jgi:hypothetical protein